MRNQRKARVIFRACPMGPNGQTDRRTSTKQTNVGLAHAHPQLGGINPELKAELGLPMLVAWMHM